MDTLAEREISFYAEDGNIDIFVSIARSVCDGVTVSRQYCSRSRGAFWTDPDVEYCNLEGGFFATAQRILRAYGKDNISTHRIGSKANWQRSRGFSGVL